MSQAKNLSTCQLKDADIAFFPMLEKHFFNHLYLDREMIRGKKNLGVADLPPIVANRIKLKWENGKTFFAKNIPLEFAFFNSNIDYRVSTLEEYWDSTMSYIQKNGFPVMWIIAPLAVCQYFFTEYVKNDGMFYLHSSQDKHNYFAVFTDSEGIKALPLKERAVIALN